MKLEMLLLPLLADAGVPMIVVALPAMLALLLPIVLIEAYVCKRLLSVTNWDAVRSNTVANLISTLVGVPMAWALMLGIEFAGVGVLSRLPLSEKSPIAQIVFLFVGAAWIAPPEGHEWIIPAAALVLLVPFFFASYASEFLVINFMIGMPEGGPERLRRASVKRAVWKANLITYAALFVATSIWLLYGYSHRFRLH